MLKVTPTTCPENVIDLNSGKERPCGARIQATGARYFDVDPETGQVEISGSDPGNSADAQEGDEIRFYCADDHEVQPYPVIGR